MNNERINAIKELQILAAQPGYIYALSILLRKDIFICPGKTLNINWHEKISFQEFSFLFGLLIKQNIDLSIPPEQTIYDYIDNTYKLLKDLHSSHMKLFADKLKASIESNANTAVDHKHYDSIFASGEMMVEPIFYGGSGAYYFQYLNLSLDRYASDSSWIKTNIGLDVADMADITYKLKSFLEAKANNMPKGINDYKDFCKRCLNLFCFQIEEIGDIEKNVLEHFLNAFSCLPGKVNSGYSEPGSYNVINSHPIIHLPNNSYFIPIIFLLAESIYESPFYWMLKDDEYVNAALRNRGDSATDIAYKLLKGVFGSLNVYKNVKVHESKKKQITDIDVLAFLGNKAVVVQVKSKKLTELSKRGDTEKLKDDFKKAIQEAYDQGLKCRSSICGEGYKLISDSGKEIKMGRSIEDAFIVCLTVDDYPAVDFQLRNFLRKNDKEPYPVAVNIFDLEIITYYLKDPYDFLYYLRQRISLSDYFNGTNEMCYLGFHLSNKLFRDKEYARMTLVEWPAQLVDANYPAVRGYEPITEETKQLHHTWKNKRFEDIVNLIKSTKEPDLTDAIFLLNDLAGEGADKLIDAMEMTKKKSLDDGDDHDFSMMFDNNNIGVTFVCCSSDIEMLESKLFVLSKCKKYQTKANIWLGIGNMAKNDGLMDMIIFNNDPWIEDLNMEEVSKQALKSGKISK